MSDNAPVLFTVPLVAQCTSRIKLVTQRWHHSYRYVDGKPVPTKTLVDRSEKWGKCQDAEGHCGDGGTALRYHRFTGTFQGLKISHVWTDTEDEGEVDVTTKWNELFSVKEGR